MMAELGLPVDAAAVAEHYRDFLDLYIADEEDAAAVAGLDMPMVLARTLMQSLADREALAELESLAGPDQLLGEQVWEGTGLPTGSARPLVWAHAEYIILAKAVATGTVDDRPA